MIRTFVGLELSLDVCEQLNRIKSELDWGEALIKWVAPSSIHLTLRYIGDTKRKKVKAISEKLPLLFDNETPFEIEITPLGAFPDGRHPKILWAGISNGEDRLKQLYSVLEEGLCRIGYPKEKRNFSPHITLGRIRSSRSKEQIAHNVATFTYAPPIKATINNVTYFQSELNPQGAIYTPLARVNLK